MIRGTPRGKDITGSGQVLAGPAFTVNREVSPRRRYCLSWKGGPLVRATEETARCRCTAAGRLARMFETVREEGPAVMAGPTPAKERAPGR